MSDTTYCTVIIRACPEGERDAILEVVGKRFGTAIREGLDLGYWYQNERAPGTAREVATELEAAAPGTSWAVWDRPDDGCLGTLFMHTPEHGSYENFCDRSGEPLLRVRDVLEIARDIIELSDVDRESLDEVLGVAMLAVFFPRSDTRVLTNPHGSARV